MCQNIKKCKFKETPLANNRWAIAQDVIAPDQEGTIQVHRNSTWDFEFVSDKREVFIAFAAYEDGEPLNHIEYQGELGN